MIAIAARRGVIAAADFQGLPLLDNFNRANEDPLSDSIKWTQIPGVTSAGLLKVVSNQVAKSTPTDASDHGMYWNPLSALTNCAVQITLPVVPASGGRIRLWLRVNPSTGACYFAQLLLSGTSGIFRNAGSGSSTSIASANIGGLTAGDVLKFSAVGTTLTVTKNGAVVISGTDATFTNGAVGIGLFDTTARLDDCFGGSL